VILPFIEMCMGCTDVGQNVDCIMLSCSATLAVLKILWFRIYANNLINNYKSALNDYLTIEDIEERIIMRKHAFAARIVSFPQLCFCYFCSVAFILTPFINHDKTNQNVTAEDIVLEYPIPSKCTMKYFHAPINMYKIFVIIQSMSLLTVTNANIGNIYLLCNIFTYLLFQII